MALADNPNFIGLEVSNIADDRFAAGGVQLEVIIRTDLELDPMKPGYEEAAVLALRAACEKYKEESGAKYKLITTSALSTPTTGCASGAGRKK